MVGKSSLVNAFCGQDVIAAGENSETTTTIVEKALDIPPYGHLLLVDTIAIDYVNDLKQNHSEKIIALISSADFVIVVLDAREKLSPEERNIFYNLKKMVIPFVAAVNKIEYGINTELINVLRVLNVVHFEISCKENVGIDALKSLITRHLPMEQI
jgi:small GTP-binding protein